MGVSRYLGWLLSSAILCMVCSHSSLAVDFKFHPPQTEAEKVLDKIFSLEGEEDSKLIPFILRSAGSDRVKDKGYVQFFTAALLKTWWKTRREWQLCNETPTGEFCGLDYSPIKCFQDPPDKFLFHTLKSGPGSVAIIVVEDGVKVDPRYLHYYRLLKHKDRWKLDGVYCGELKKFNMSSVP